MEKIDKFINEYPEHGYRSLAQFVEDAARRRADELRVFELTPRFEHFNLKDNHATIHDKKIECWIDVYFTQNGKVPCEYCDSSICEHAKFALTAPEIIDPLRKRG